MAARWQGWAAFLVGALLAAGRLGAVEPQAPRSDSSLSPDDRAHQLEQAMTSDERQSLLHGIFAVPLLGKLPPDAIGSAGYVPGIPRLGIPALQESDASLGVANPFNVRPNDGATPLPSALSLAATWNPDIAYRGGAMIGQEAWRKGFNVLLAGGANLARDPRNGRNFEYLGEDPLLAGTLAGESIRGIQDQHVVSTVKHFAINDQETGRQHLNALIGAAAFRESDLLAFELAIEGGHPGSVMCSYNKVNGPYACSSEFLMTNVLKQDWAYPGWVMSDWGAVHDVMDAKAGLDQESGQQIDREVFFGKPLADAAASGAVPPERISDMAHRILRSMFAVGLLDHPPTKAPIDAAADEAVAREAGAQGIVLLTNKSALLPLGGNLKHVLVVGGHADFGVLSGGGSSQVIPNGKPLVVPLGGDGPFAMLRVQLYDPSSPLAAIKAKLAGAEVHYNDGAYPAAAANAARQADVAIVFATQWMVEGEDAPDLTLPNGQDALIEAVARANPRTIVVLETGGPVLMPWLNQAGAVVEAWYPGAKGGEAIADVLFGDADASGRLPITFPRSEAQLPRSEIPGYGLKEGTAFDVDYTIEGSDVGYRWYARRHIKPLFPFGYGLSYTRFSYADLKVEGGKTVAVSFEVRNAGDRPGTDVAQLYLTGAAGRKLQRLIGWERVTLKPGESRRVTIAADPRLLADWDETVHGWRINAGRYDVALGASAADLGLRGGAAIEAGSFKP
jgi:beta-glucosidase